MVLGEERPEDAPRVEVRGDGAFLMLRHAPREPQEVLLHRKRRIGSHHSIEGDHVARGGPSLGVREENRSPGAPREQRGSDGKGYTAAEELRLDRSREHVAVREEHHDPSLTQRPEEGAESILGRAHENALTSLERARGPGEPGMELHSRDDVDLVPETRHGDARQLPVAHVGGRDDRAPSPRERLVEKLHSLEAELEVEGERAQGALGEVFEEEPVVALEDRARGVADLWRVSGETAGFRDPGDVGFDRFAAFRGEGELEAGCGARQGIDRGLGEAGGELERCREKEALDQGRAGWGSQSNITVRRYTSASGSVKIGAGFYLTGAPRAPRVRSGIASFGATRGRIQPFASDPDRGVRTIRFEESVRRLQLGETAASGAALHVRADGVHAIIAPAIDFRGAPGVGSRGRGFWGWLHGVLLGSSGPERRRSRP